MARSISCSATMLSLSRDMVVVVSISFTGAWERETIAIFWLPLMCQKRSVIKSEMKERWHFGVDSKCHCSQLRLRCVFVVCVCLDGAAFEEIAEVLDCEVNGKKFTIDGAVEFSGFSLVLEKKAMGSHLPLWSCSSMPPMAWADASVVSQVDARCVGMN